MQGWILGTVPGDRCQKGQVSRLQISILSVWGSPG